MKGVLICRSVHLFSANGYDDLVFRCLELQLVSSKPQIKSDEHLFIYFPPSAASLSFKYTEKHVHEERAQSANSCGRNISPPRYVASCKCYSSFFYHFYFLFFGLVIYCEQKRWDLISVKSNNFLDGDALEKVFCS